MCVVYVLYSHDPFPPQGHAVTPASPVSMVTSKGQTLSAKSVHVTTISTQRTAARVTPCQGSVCVVSTTLRDHVVRAVSLVTMAALWTRTAKVQLRHVRDVLPLSQSADNLVRLHLSPRPNTI